MICARQPDEHSRICYVITILMCGEFVACSDFSRTVHTNVFTVFAALSMLRVMPSRSTVENPS